MLPPGTTVGDRYEIVRLIDQGGMGFVYEAEHRDVKRRVALKVLRPQLANHAVVVERFVREARAAAAIANEHIVDVTDFGIHDGAPFMVMEYLEGQSLGTHLKRHGRMDIQAALRVMAQLLEGLGAAHGAGIVHRDLKPDNVFLTRRGDRTDFVKLLDFGVSKLLQGPDGGEAPKSLTQSGTAVGTPSHMSPEQALARKDIDARSDIYAAGVIFYQMLTGHLPIEAESSAEVMMKIVLREEPIRPVREVNPAVAPGLEAAIFRALEKDREQRFDTAAAFARAIGPWDASALGAADTLLQVPELPAPAAPEPSPAPAPAAPRTSTVPSSSRRTSATPIAWVAQASSDVATTPPPPPEGPSGPAATPPRARRPLSVALLAAGAVVVAGGAVVLVLRPRGARPIAPVATAPHQELPTTATVNVRFVDLPAGASLELDGAPTTLLEHQFARGSRHAVVVSAPGFRSARHSVEAVRDESVHLVLTREEPPAPPNALPPNALPSALPSAPPSAPLPVSPTVSAPIRAARPSPGAAGARPAARGNIITESPFERRPGRR